MSRKSAPPVCNKDCEHCPYPDCINDALDYDDYVASAKMEKEFIFPKTAKQKKVAAQQKAYREANRERLVAQWKAYYEANRERIAARQKSYREANRDRFAAQRKIQTYRQSIGLSQRAFAAPLGVTPACVSNWEHGSSPANWPLLQSVYPDLRPE